MSCACNPLLAINFACCNKIEKIFHRNEMYPSRGRSLGGTPFIPVIGCATNSSFTVRRAGPLEF